MVTNFDNEMMGLYRSAGGGLYADQAPRSEVGRALAAQPGLRLLLLRRRSRRTARSAGGQRPHRRHCSRNVNRDARYAQPPHLFLNRGKAGFRDVAAEVGADFAKPKVGRGAAFGDFDNDGDLDVLITTNHGPAYLYRNDQFGGNRSIRFRLVGTKSNRDAIGAVVQVHSGGETSSRMVKSGSSYLSQSELPVTFGLGKRDIVERVVISWPSGRTEEFKNLKPGRYECVEGKGIALTRM